ncbi:glutathione peroxidase-like [Crassostrea virginica]
MLLLIVSLFGLLASPSLALIGKCSQPASDTTSIYDFTLPNIFKTGSIDFADFRGKVVLVVNVATYCDHTPQFLGLNDLQKEFGADLQIIGVPTDQFHFEEPGANGTEIMNGLRYVRPGNGFVPAFPLSSKTEVNGLQEHKMFTYLKKYCEPTDELFYPGLTYQGNKVHDIRWNFEKILVDKTGKPVKRYNVYVLPASLRDDIRAEINKNGASHKLPILGSFLG